MAAAVASDVGRLFILASFVQTVCGHGRLIDPAARSSMFRYGFENYPNYNDHQLFCGGVQVQYEQNKGKCGVCGDPWQGPRDNEPGGKYANGILVKKYKPESVITVVVQLTANHKGWFEFSLCPKCDASTKETEGCFQKFPLRVASTNKKRFPITGKEYKKEIKVKVILPKNVKCPYCVLRWKYNAGNSWGTDNKTGKSCVGCGNQEQFYGCADVSIGYDQVKVGAKPVKIKDCSELYLQGRAETFHRQTSLRLLILALGSVWLITGRGVGL